VLRFLLSHVRAASVTIIGRILLLSCSLLVAVPLDAWSTKHRQNALERDAQEVGIFKAILRDVVARERLVVTKPGTTRVIGLVKTTQSVCPAVVRSPCVPEDVYRMVQREAATGRWSLPLAAAFREATKQGAEIPPFEYPGLALDTRAVLRADYNNPALLDVSKPAIVSGEALVCVHFAGTYSWIILLTGAKDKWKVSQVVLLSIG